MDPRISSYLEKNKQWASDPSYKSPIEFKDMQRKGREREDGTVIVVACTDPRVTPEEFLGMDGSSKATVVRTAGGRVHAAMSTLLVLAAVGNLGKKGVVMIVHHTDCGLVGGNMESSDGDEGIRGVLKGCTKLNADEEVLLDGMVFGSFEDPEVSVKEDVEYLRNGPWFKGAQILGFVQDTKTGVLKEVVGI